MKYKKCVNCGYAVPLSAYSAENCSRCGADLFKIVEPNCDICMWDGEGIHDNTMCDPKANE